MRYHYTTQEIKTEGIPNFRGEIVDVMTGQVVYTTTMMSEEYLIQNLDNKIRKLENEYIKNQEAEQISKDSKIHDSRSSGHGSYR